MKKCILILLVLLFLVPLTSCDNLHKPSLGQEVSLVNYQGYTIDDSWDVFDLMNIVSLNHKEYSFDYKAKFQVGDSEEFEVTGSEFNYYKLRTIGGREQIDNTYYRYATTTKNMAKFELYEVGSSYAPAANRYVANGIPVVASCIYEDRTTKTLYGGPVFYPTEWDAEGMAKQYYDYYIACTRFPQIFYQHNIFNVPTKYVENYNYSYKLYENYIVFNFENPYGMGFESGVMRPEEELSAMRPDAYFKAEIYLNIETSTIDYYYFDTLSYATRLVPGLMVKCTATVARVNITNDEIQKKIDGVFTANETTIGFGSY